MGLFLHFLRLLLILLLQSGRKETVLDCGRQVTGTLKGYDRLLNQVLDKAIQFLRGAFHSDIGWQP